MQSPSQAVARLDHHHHPCTDASKPALGLPQPRAWQGLNPGAPADRPCPRPTRPPRSQDGDFSEEHFRNTVNAALANNVGNMLNRTLNLLKKNCGGALPVGADELPAEHPLREAAARWAGRDCPWAPQGRARTQRAGVNATSSQPWGQLGATNTV
jgi:hypothetical protein